MKPGMVMDAACRAKAARMGNGSASGIQSPPRRFFQNTCDYSNCQKTARCCGGEGAIDELSPDLFSGMIARNLWHLFSMPMSCMNLTTFLQSDFETSLPGHEDV